MIGRASSCAAVIAPWLAADAMPTRFSAGFSTSAMFRNVAVPVTTTSAFSDSVSTTSAVTDAAAVDDDVPAQHAEVEQPERELGVARRHRLEPILPGLVRRGGQFGGANDEIDGDAGKRAPVWSRTRPVTRAPVWAWAVGPDRSSVADRNVVILSAVRACTMTKRHGKSTWPAAGG